MTRTNGRRADQLRTTRITRRFTDFAPGSVLIETGKTRVLCTASFEQGVPGWRKDSGLGWVTAEYDMLPGATDQRKRRNRTKVDGRTQEIQRLIGRSMRTAVDLGRLGENTIILDCDVIQADGGTRTAGITGAYVALCDAVAFARREGWLTDSPITDAVAAVSVGIVKGRPLLDLDYREDVDAQVDMNVAMNAKGRFIEVQGTGEEHTFTRQQLDRMLKLSEKGIRALLREQKKALAKRLSSRRRSR